MLYKTILAFKKKWVKCFWEIHYLGIQGRGKGHKVKTQVPKHYFKKNFGSEFGILGKFPFKNMVL